MSKKMLIDATHAEETRVVVVDGNKVEEFDFETLNKRQLAGNIYLAKVTRVEPSLQAAFVDYGGNRHGFLAFAEIHPDYYQIPVADRKALLDEERAYNRAQDDEDNRRSRPAPRPRPEVVKTEDEVQAAPQISGMDVVDLDDDTATDAVAHSQGTDQPHDDHHENDHTHDHDQDEGDTPFRAIDHAAETDDEIESIAEEDVAEEISQTRKPRARRYKIQEVVKVRQIMLIQVVKEERGNKGAALTTYLSLAGRYCVLMPNTARGGGISRKITVATDRKKLKEIAQEIEVPEGAGLIIRTAGAKRTKPEIKRDYEYLMRLWEQIRELTLKSIAPAAIYEEGDLIKRSIRDLYSREIDEILVEGDVGFRTAKDFMRMIMPSHAKVVQQYNDTTPLFARFQVESYLGGMFNPTVQLKSGGYIVIGITEALVAIDVNSGRATKEGSIEDTALKTNMEAAEEIARQLRLRDLAGLIVIDFIDMEERRNNASVEKKIKDKLKTDRARIQVGRISGFGLLEMSRQRLRPGMLESTTQPCAHCHGTGLIRSDDSLALQVLRALEEEGTRKRSKEVLLKAPVGIINFLFNQKREHLALIEARYDMAVRLEADPALVSPDYAIEKFKTATRVVPINSVISGNASLMGAAVDEDEDMDIVDDLDEVEEAEEVEEAAPVAATSVPRAAEGDAPGKKKRRRRRKKKPGPNGQTSGSVDGQSAEGSDDEASDDDGDEEFEDDASPADAVAVEEAPVVIAESAVEAAPEAVPEFAVESAVESSVESAVESAVEAPKKRTRAPRGGAKAAVAPVEAPAAEAPPKPKPTRARSTTSRTKAAAKPVEIGVEGAAQPPVETPMATPVETAVEAGSQPPVVMPVETPVAPAVEILSTAPVEVQTQAPVAEPAGTPEPVADTAAEAAADDPAKPKRKGWWSLGR